MAEKQPEDERLDEWLSRGFDRGSYANAYETEDYAKGLKTSLKTPRGPVALKAAFRAAFTLGFFSSYELHEMGEHQDAYLEAYRSAAGQRCVALGFLDPIEEETLTELDVMDLRVGDEVAVWWGGGWARLVSIALHEGPGGGVAALFEDGTADVVFDTGAHRGGVHVVRGARGTGALVGDLFAGRKERST